MTDGGIVGKLSTLADEFAAQTAERLSRTSLDRADFDRIAETGYLNVGIPKSHGGLFESIPASAQPTRTR